MPLLHRLLHLLLRHCSRRSFSSLNKKKAPLSDCVFFPDFPLPPFFPPAQKLIGAVPHDPLPPYTPQSLIRHTEGLDHAPAHAIRTRDTRDTNRPSKTRKFPPNCSPPQTPKGRHNIHMHGPFTATREHVPHMPQQAKVIQIMSITKNKYPLAPDEPVEPLLPIEPLVPLAPVAPNVPEDPVTPDDPLPPELPVEPSVPEAPLVPVDPLELVTPELPLEPLDPVLCICSSRATWTSTASRTCSTKLPFDPLEPIEPLAPELPDAHSLHSHQQSHLGQSHRSHQSHLSNRTCPMCHSLHWNYTGQEPQMRHSSLLRLMATVPLPVLPYAPRSRPNQSFCLFQSLQKRPMTLWLHSSHHCRLHRCPQRRQMSRFRRNLLCFSTSRTSCRAAGSL